ncbi:YiiX/YebB-like N1pC/P60 family cysteine hydrolase [Alcaligenes faecalis]|nr:YiiX/YebB-like N1pC/P60 family cysteine hydrolase [Alcaligenes faecalis]
MKAIDYRQLQLGDILLTTSQRPTSWSVRAGTKSDISHAMLYVANGSVIDSTSDGVHARNLQKVFYEDDCAIYALRPIQPLTAEERQTIIDYARSAIGTKYALREAARSVTKPKGSGSVRQFCSRLVARAYAEAGIQLSDNPDFCTPEQLKGSPSLQKLPSPVVEISAEEIAEIESRPNRADGMLQVTNAFLQQVRSFAPKVESINDALELLVLNQAFDDQVHAALKSSGYLDFWQLERREFNWRYDLDAMKELASKEPNLLPDLKNYCLDSLRDIDNGDFDHWGQNLHAWRQKAQSAPLKSFVAMAQLYENLVEGVQLRRLVAESWLAR